MDISKSGVASHQVSFASIQALIAAHNSGDPRATVHLGQGNVPAANEPAPEVVPEPVPDAEGRQPQNFAALVEEHLQQQQQAEQPATESQQAPGATPTPEQAELEWWHREGIWRSQVLWGGHAWHVGNPKALNVLKELGKRFFYWAADGAMYDQTSLHTAKRGRVESRKSFAAYCGRHIGTIELRRRGDPPPGVVVPVYPHGLNDVRDANIGEVFWDSIGLQYDFNRVFMNVSMYPTEHAGAGPADTFNVFDEFRNDIVKPDMAATEDDVRLFVEHVHRVAGGSKVAAERFLDRLAMNYQKPWQRVTSFDVIVGPQGSGKSMLLKTYRALFGDRMVQAVTLSIFAGRFDGAINHALFVIIDEAEDERTKLDGAKIRLYSTEEWRGSEGKNKDATQVRNLLHFVVSVNKLTSIKLERGDRRANIMRHEDVVITYEQAEEFASFLASPERVAKLAGWLAKRDLSNFKPYSHAPATDEKQAAILESQGDRVARIAQLYEDEQAPFNTDIINVPEVVKYMCRNVDEFARGGTFSDKGLVDALRVVTGRTDLKSKVVKVGKNGARLMVIRHFDKWGEQDSTKWAEHYGADPNGRCYPGAPTPDRPFTVPSDDDNQPHSVH